MHVYFIYNERTGQEAGHYNADTPDAALAAMLKETGRSFYDVLEAAFAGWVAERA